MVPFKDAGSDFSVTGPVELARKLAAQDEAAQCFAQKWLELGVGRELGSQDADSVTLLVSEFKQRNLDIRALIVAVTKTRSFLGQL